MSIPGGKGLFVFFGFFFVLYLFSLLYPVKLNVRYGEQLDNNLLQKYARTMLMLGTK